MRYRQFLIVLLLTSPHLYAADRVVRMTIPGVKGALELNTGVKSPEMRVRPDGKEVQLRAFGRADGLEISAFLQHVTFPASAEKCRDEWWPGTKNAMTLQRDDLQEIEVKDGIARVEFIIPEFQGIKLRQKNVYGYVGSGDLCAEVHMSKAGFKPQDQRLFDEVLSSVKLLADEAAEPSRTQGTPASPDVQYYFAQGSKEYMRSDYAAAAVSYQKALDLEKQKRTLSNKYFRVLVDNLGMSYGMSGQLPRAKATFEYGIAEDPEYPLFYYNMACFYGEMGEKDQALAQLRLAYSRKGNMISGEPFPDPLKDDSFRAFVSDQTFVSAVKEMAK